MHSRLATARTVWDPIARAGQPFLVHRGGLLIIKGLLLLMGSLLVGATRADDSEPFTRPTVRPAAAGLDVSNASSVPSLGWVDDDLELKAHRVTTWQEDQTQVLVMERGVSIAVGTYGFQADRAVVRIESGPSGQGHNTTHRVSMALDNSRPLDDQRPVQAHAPRLNISVTTQGSISLSTDLLARSDSPIPAPDPVSSSLGAPSAPDEHPPSAVERIQASPGTVSFHADRIVFQEHEDQDSTLILMGHIGVGYQSHDDGRAVTLTARNAVVFIDPAATDLLGTGDVDVNAVRGAYLEDNVMITDGQYTIRAPRVFYDLARDKAVVLDAVFHTWNDRRQLPIYLRAKLLRQEAAGSWSAHDALLTTSEFAVPHFAIGANKITLRREQSKSGDGGEIVYPYRAEDMTPQLGGVPVGYWPALAGEAGQVEDMPLQRIDGSISRQNGPTIETTWNLFTLTGQPAPAGVELLGHADFLGDHGPAVGLNLRYDQQRMWGAAEGYLIFRDEGDDEFADRRDIDFDGDTRGFALWRHRHDLEDNWQLSIEFAYDSDETFLEEFFRDEAELSKPYETSIYLKNQEDDRAFTFLAQYDLLDFTPQTTTLQAPGYTVEKLPELGFYTVGASLLDDHLTWFSESRVTRMRIRVGGDTPADRGFTAGQSSLLFGQSQSLPFRDALRASGVSQDIILRVDSRHELQAPSKLGIFDLTPYVAGRVTAYDENFAAFSGDDERIRLWGAIGFRAHTQFSRVHDRVRVRALDIHRLRHIVEPNIDLFWSGSNVNPEDLPVYDHDVESIREGLGFRFGVRNTLQTQRGGVGRWRSVDWMVFDTDVIVRSDDADIATEIARYFSYRPEFSLGGNHLHGQWAWSVSEALAVAGEITFNIERERTAQWRLGSSLQHTPRLSCFVDYAEIDQLSSRLLNYGFTYQLTRKYHVRFDHVVDFGEDDSRNIEIRLERKLPRWRMIFLARIDELDDEQLFGLVLLPEGFGSSRRASAGALVGDE